MKYNINYEMVLDKNKYAIFLYWSMKIPDENVRKQFIINVFVPVVSIQFKLVHENQYTKFQV